MSCYRCEVNVQESLENDELGRRPIEERPCLFLHLVGGEKWAYKQWNVKIRFSNNSALFWRHWTKYYHTHRLWVWDGSKLVESHVSVKVEDYPENWTGAKKRWPWALSNTIGELLQLDWWWGGGIGHITNEILRNGFRIRLQPIFADSEKWKVTYIMLPPWSQC